jgi:hypothetical protein
MPSNKNRFTIGDFLWRSALAEINYINYYVMHLAATQGCYAIPTSEATYSRFFVASVE